MLKKINKNKLKTDKIEIELNILNKKLEIINETTAVKLNEIIKLLKKK